MQKDGRTLSLYRAAAMDVGAFNKEAVQYDVLMDEADLPIDRLVKFSLFLSRKDDDSSHTPTNAEYTAMTLDTAVARIKSTEPLASFYATLTNGLRDALSDMLQFQEKLPRGGYKAALLRFNEDGKLEPVDDIMVAGQGWIRVLGARHGYPIETSRDACVVENLDDPNLSDKDIKGFWYVDPDPIGQIRLVLRNPRCNDGRLLFADVSKTRALSDRNTGALRVRGCST
jgi:hypothetical protein